MPYGDDVYNEGAFNAHYGGTEAQLRQYDITLEVNAIETTSTLMF